jgi:DDE family transposase
MRIELIVRQVLSRIAGSIHKARFRALVATVVAVVRVGRLSVSAIGRAAPWRSRPKHAIKRVDRLLSNGHLRLECSAVFGSICQWVVADTKRPVLLTDGFHALVAAVPVGGRAMPIYLEVHREQVQGQPRIEARFLQRLARLLPEGARPVVVVDAGFRGPFFRAVMGRDWDFVGRIRGTTNVVLDDRKYDRAALNTIARPIPRDLGPVRLYTHAKRLSARVVVVRQRRRPGPRRAPASALQASIRAAGREPWILATSLLDLSPEAVVATYALRMKVEETFRDAKNHRFGWSLRHVRSGSADRLTNLLLLTSLAILAVTLVGLAAETAGLHRAYQANTLRRRVLSWFVLGAAVIRRLEPRLRAQKLAAIRALFLGAYRELSPFFR